MGIVCVLLLRIIGDTLGLACLIDIQGTQFPAADGATQNVAYNATRSGKELLPLPHRKQVDAGDGDTVSPVVAIDIPRWNSIGFICPSP